MTRLRTSAETGTPSTQVTTTRPLRDRIRLAMRQAGLPVDQVTPQHTPFLQQAGIRVECGTPMGRVLRGIGYSAATRLLLGLKQASLQEEAA